MIYLAKPAGINFCKVGFTLNLLAKAKQFETCWPDGVEIILVREGNIQKEYQMHYHLRGFLLRREWFRFCKELVDVFETKQLEENTSYGHLWRIGVDPDYIQSGLKNKGRPKHEKLAKQALLKAGIDKPIQWPTSAQIKSCPTR